MGKSLPGAGVGDRPSPGSSATVSLFILDLAAILPSSSPSLPNVMPRELLRLQKLPLFFLFRLGWLDAMLSVPGEAGRKLELSGDALFEPRLSALKERRFRTLLGRFAFLTSGEGEVVAEYAVVVNCAGCIPVLGVGTGGVAGNAPGMLEAELEK